MTIGTEDLNFFMLLSMQRTGDNISDTNFNFYSLYINKVYRTQLNQESNSFEFSTRKGKKQKQQTIILKIVPLP